MFTLRLLRSRTLSSVLAAGGVLALSACGEDPLIVTGRVDVAVSSDTTLVVDFPNATRLERGPSSSSGRAAGECTVTADSFSVSVSSSETSTGLRSLRVSSDEASVDIGGVVYTALAGTGCFIDTRVSDPGYGTITFDLDCGLSDGEGHTVSAVGDLAFEGCR